MTVRKPLVRVGGRIRQLPPGDSLPPPTVAIADVTGLPIALDGKQPTLGYKITVSQTEPPSPSVGDVWISY